MKSKSIYCVLFGILCLLFGLISLFSLPLIITYIIHTQLVLSPSSYSYHSYVSPPIPVYLSVYFMNVTNTEECLEGVAKPNLNEVGPFVYRIKFTKKDSNLTSHGQILNFREKNEYKFDRKLSVGDENTLITTINMPLASALNDISLMPSGVNKLIATAVLERFPFFFTKNVSQLLFEGYTDTLTRLAPFFNPKMPKSDRFGFFYGKNETDDGLFRVNTGTSDIFLLNNIVSYNGLPNLNFWSGEKCNSLKGSTNGELVPPLKANQDSLLLFRSYLCRAWKLVIKDKNIYSIGGLKAYRFIPDENNFKNEIDFPPNSCFKPNALHRINNSIIDGMSVEAFSLAIEQIIGFKLDLNVTNEILENLNPNHFHLNYFNLTSSDMLEQANLLMSQIKSFTQDKSKLDSHNESQISESRSMFDSFLPSSKPSMLPSGVSLLSPCYYDSPIYASYPHFLNADRSYVDAFTGLKPNSSLHQFYLDVEPQLGIPLEMIGRIQLNIRINQPSLSWKFRKVPRVVFPMIWTEFRARVSHEIASQLYWEIKFPSTLTTIISAILVAIGVFFMIIFLSGSLKHLCFHKNVNHNESHDRVSTTSETDNLIGDERNIH